MVDRTGEKYGVILADPPWFFNKRKNPKTRFGSGIYGRYPPMKPKQLKEMAPFVKGLAEENCALFLWVSCPHLDEALELIKSWGFKYKGVAFAWVKISKKGIPIAGPGHYTGSNVELVLLAIKGNMPVDTKLVNQIIMTQRLKPHSRKPADVRHRIELMYKDVSRIELFAREQVPGWTASGLDITGEDYTQISQAVA